MGTSKMLPSKYACLDSVTCRSSDARRKYEDGTSFCFSCHEFFPKSAEENMEPAQSPSPSPTPKKRADGSGFKKILSQDEINDFPTRGFKERQIEKTVCEFFGVKVSYSDDGEIAAHYYPYEDGKAYKVRTLPKDFTWIGKSDDLFGRSKFSNGGKRLVITEGEIDCLSVAQASFDKYQKIYPTVAMSSSAMTKSFLIHRDWLRSFDEIVLCLDNDEPGHKARDEAIKILGYDKVKVATLPEKDPDKVYREHGGARLLQCIFDAAKVMPSGIIGKEKLWDSLVNYNSAPHVPYPPCLAGVNTKLKGMRGGEITLFISGTGSGKSTILREVMLHLLKTTPKEIKLGVVSLEESPPETARKLSGMAIGKNPAKDEIPMDELKVGFDEVFGDDRIVLLDHQGSISDGSIIDKLEYMCLSGCKYLFVDHITILVSEGMGDLTGNEAQDKVMNDLLRLVKRYPDVWIGLVSHLRKPPGGGTSFEEGKLPSIDDIRGSGSIKQISFDIISFARNLVAKSDDEKNTIKMRILKSRYTGLSGDVPGARYNYDTGRLIGLKEVGNSEDFTRL